MKSIIPHLTIENCQEAITFYQQIFGGEIKNVQLADGIDMFKGHEGKYIHSELHINENCIIYLNDVFNSNVTQGNHIQLSLDLEKEEIKTLYDALATEGKVRMELQDTFWNARYAIVTDKFGVTWELSAPK